MKNEYTYIYEVYKENSFSRAARNLFITQPTLSSAIKKTEEQLGITIFDRSTIPIRLTDEGEIVIRYIEKMQQIDQELLDELESVHNLEYGHIRLAGSSFFVADMLSLVVQRFNTLYPGISLELTECDTNTLYPNVLENRIDLVLDAGHYDENFFTSETIASEQILLAVPAPNPLNDRFRSLALTRDDVIAGKHLDPSCPSVDLSAFGNENFIVLKHGHDLHERAYDMCHRAGFEPNHTLALQQLSTVAAIAGKGLGVCFLTDSVIRYSAIGDTALLYYRLDDPSASRDVFMAWQKNKLLTRAEKAFLETARKVLTTG